MCYNYFMLLKCFLEKVKYSTVLNISLCYFMVLISVGSYHYLSKDQSLKGELRFQNDLRV